MLSSVSSSCDLCTFPHEVALWFGVQSLLNRFSKCSTLHSIETLYFIIRQAVWTGPWICAVLWLSYFQITWAVSTQSEYLIIQGISIPPWYMRGQFASIIKNCKIGIFCLLPPSSAVAGWFSSIIQLDSYNFHFMIDGWIGLNVTRILVPLLRNVSKYYMFDETARAMHTRLDLYTTY